MEIQMKNRKNLKDRGFTPKGTIRVRGATAPSKLPYVWVNACEKIAWVPYGLFRGNGKDASDMLASRGIILLNKEWAELKAKVDLLKKFPPKPLIEKAGWSRSMRHYALPDGTVFGAAEKSGDETPVVLFDPHPWKVAMRGSPEGWTAKVAAPLSKQYVATFVIMIMFSPPLLRLIGRTMNFGFELAGPKGVGKTTAQCLASSVWGPAVSASGRNFWFPAHATVAGLESLMAEHDDMSMVVEEANLFAAGESPHRRSAKTHQRVFQWAEGAEKARHKKTSQRRSRFVWLTSTNEALEEILAPGSDELADAAADRELTIPIGSDRQFGLFDSVPEPYSSASDFAASLTRALAQEYGHAIRVFLNGLVSDANTDRKALKARIQALIAKFRNSVEVNTDSGSARRVVDAFGLVYAAGRLAQDYGALPPSMKCLKSARIVYELNRATVDSRSPLERLYDYATRDDLIHFKAGALPDITVKAVKKSAGFIRTKRGGRRQLIITPEALDRAFASRSWILNDREVGAVLEKDRTHRSTKLRVSARGKPVRVYCFRLPADFA